MEKRLGLANEKLAELLEVHKDYPITTNSLFVKSNKQRRQENVMKSIEERVKREFERPGQKVGVDEITRLLASMTTATTSTMDMDMVAAEDALDNMNAFYEV